MNIARMAVSSIASCGRSCRSLFGQLRTIWTSADPAATAKISLASIKTESDRYELWANNIAALQDAYLPTSLEYRIREDASARNVVEKALAYLEESLQFAFEIVSGERPNETWEETAPSDGKASDTATKVSSEILELYLSIQEAITNLFRLSMIIRKKPERDEYTKAATRYKIDPTSDIVHVGDKYPTAKKSELPWLMKRFGISITHRRQYLLYRREHQQRMQDAHRLKAGPDGNTVWSGTKASTYLPDENAVIDPQENVLPMKIIIEPSQKRPQTEYADSSRGKDGATDFLRTPPLPMRQDGSRVEYGEHFECPYCWRVQNMENKYEWKKHVLSDLKPYVCTFQSCELNMFDSQHEWFTHELQFHRKQWLCSVCRDRAPESRPDLIAHLDNDHQKELKGQNADVFVESCQVIRIDASECPLCKEYGEKLQNVNKSFKCDVSLKQFQHHLGVHMQQLALAALPQDNTEEGNDEVDSDVEAEEGAEILEEAIKPSNSEIITEISNITKEENERTKTETNINNVINPVEKPDQPEPIKFEDAMGRKFSIPFTVCKKIDGMEELIRQAFLHVEVLRPHVNARRYDLVSSEGKVIERDQWENIVQPGSKISMLLRPLPPPTTEEVQQSRFPEPNESQKEQLDPEPTMAPSVDFEHQYGSPRPRDKKAKKAAKAAIVSKWDIDSDEDEEENKNNEGDGGDSGGASGDAGDKKKDDDKGNGDIGYVNADDEWEVFTPSKSKKKGKKGKKGMAHVEPETEPIPGKLSFDFDSDFDDDDFDALRASIDNNSWTVNRGKPLKSTAPYAYGSLDEPETKEDSEQKPDTDLTAALNREHWNDTQKSKNTPDQTYDGEVVAKMQEEMEKMETRELEEAFMIEAFKIARATEERRESERRQRETAAQDN